MRLLGGWLSHCAPCAVQADRFAMRDTNVTPVTWLSSSSNSSMTRLMSACGLLYVFCLWFAHPCCSQACSNWWGSSDITTLTVRVCLCSWLLCSCTLVLLLLHSDAVAVGTVSARSAASPCQQQHSRGGSPSVCCSSSSVLLAAFCLFLTLSSTDVLLLLNPVRAAPVQLCSCACKGQ